MAAEKTLQDVLDAARGELPDVVDLAKRHLGELELDERGRTILEHALAEQRSILADAVNGADVALRQASVNARVAQVLSAMAADGYSAWGAAVEELAQGVGRVALAVGRGALMGLVG